MSQSRNHSSLFLDATLLRRDDFTVGVGRFRFSVDPPLQFRPGQYATLAVEHEGALIQRPYSICSSPYEDQMEFYLDMIPDGAVSPLVWGMEPGARILVRRRAEGRFLLDETLGARHHLMLATVTGAGPFLSMIRAQRDRIARGDSRNAVEMILIHGCSRSAELGLYVSEMEALAEEPWFHYLPTVSRPWEDPGWAGETGRVEDVVRKHADRLGLVPGDTVAYACGNAAMIRNVRDVLRRAGYPGSRIREEEY